MNWGCLSFLILFPAGIFVWAAGEKRRRNAMPPDELKKLEDEEDYGEINPDIECIYCHSKNCVRTRSTTDFIGSPAHIMSEDNLKETRLYSLNPVRRLKWMTHNELGRTAELWKARCMKCGSFWDMLPPEKES